MTKPRVKVQAPTLCVRINKEDFEAFLAKRLPKASSPRHRLAAAKVAKDKGGDWVEFIWEEK